MVESALTLAKDIGDGALREALAPLAEIYATDREAWEQCDDERLLLWIACVHADGPDARTVVNACAHACVEKAIEPLVFDHEGLRRSLRTLFVEGAVDAQGEARMYLLMQAAAGRAAEALTLARDRLRNIAQLEMRGGEVLARSARRAWATQLVLAVEAAQGAFGAWTEAVGGVRGRLTGLKVVLRARLRWDTAAACVRGA